MDFLIRFAQVHETFRKAEIESLAVVEGIDLEVLSYTDEVRYTSLIFPRYPPRQHIHGLKHDWHVDDPKDPFCIVRLENEEAARRLVRRSILAISIHHLWGSSSTLDSLHAHIRQHTSHAWPDFQKSSWKFHIYSFQNTRANTDRLSIINSFSYLPFNGPIQMKDPDETWTVFEKWPVDAVPTGKQHPDWIYFGRLVGTGSREVILKYDLKKRGYISTTSMDAELSLITANITLAGPGKLFYDPFVGTGSFPLACAHFGTYAWGSDIDGRSIRGEGGKKSLPGNFEQYGTRGSVGGFFTADLTNTPIIRARKTWDGIVCDPPYGVREGLHVLGIKDPAASPWLVEKGKARGMEPDYVPPKKPYSFLAMLDDILVFASDTLVDNGRLSFWMPTANDEQLEISVPAHPRLEIVSVCVQAFYKWSRRLITYRRIPDAQVPQDALETYARRKGPNSTGTTADELNPFRRGYFTKFDTSVPRRDSR